jgi:DNA-directed RNA polymerase subunit RPC12/RpoP
MSDKIRTDLYCTECKKNFVAKFDTIEDGNHIIVCPWCGHQHCRVVRKGVVTGDRYSSTSRADNLPVPSRNVWKSQSGVETTSAAHFLREKWIEKAVK